MSRYDIEKFDPPPDPDLVCCICQCVLDKAVESPCRHVFCQVCIERWLLNQHTCPTCRKRTKKQDLKPVLPLVQNMINRLLMICDFRDHGCFEKIMLEQYDKHVGSCGFEMKSCRFIKCGIKVLRMHLEEHERELCEHRELVCEGECGLMIALSDRPTHNCVTALKAHIDEKNRMIESLKTKLQELNNLSQSLNDQLENLRQQLDVQIDENRPLLSISSLSSSDTDITDFMSDDLSQESFFDENSSSSTHSINVVDFDNDVTAEPGEGNDVVEQVERTLVTSLVDLTSRLETARTQLRAVLDAGFNNVNTINTNNSLTNNNNNVFNSSLLAAADPSISNNANENNTDNRNVMALELRTIDRSNHNSEAIQNVSSSNGNDSPARGVFFSTMNNLISNLDRIMQYPMPRNTNEVPASTDNNAADNNVAEAGSGYVSDASDSSNISDTPVYQRSNSPDTNTSIFSWALSDSANSPASQTPAASNRQRNNSESTNLSDDGQHVHVIVSQPPDSPSDSNPSYCSSSLLTLSSAASSPYQMTPETGSGWQVQVSLHSPTTATFSSVHGTPDHTSQSPYGEAERCPSPRQASCSSPSSQSSKSSTDTLCQNSSHSTGLFSIDNLSDWSLLSNRSTRVSNEPGQESNLSSTDSDSKSQRFSPPASPCYSARSESLTDLSDHQQSGRQQSEHTEDSANESAADNAPQTLSQIGDSSDHERDWSNTTVDISNDEDSTCWSEVEFRSPEGEWASTSVTPEHVSDWSPSPNNFSQDITDKSRAPVNTDASDVQLVLIGSTDITLGEPDSTINIEPAASHTDTDDKNAASIVNNSDSSDSDDSQSIKYLTKRVKCKDRAVCNIASATNTNDRKTLNYTKSSKANPETSIQATGKKISSDTGNTSKTSKKEPIAKSKVEPNKQSSNGLKRRHDNGKGMHSPVHKSKRAKHCAKSASYTKQQSASMPPQHRTSVEPSVKPWSSSSHGNKSSSTATSTTADNAQTSQSLNVRIDLSLINYSGQFLPQVSSAQSTNSSTNVQSHTSISPLHSTNSINLNIRDAGVPCNRSFRHVASHRGTTSRRNEHLQNSTYSLRQRDMIRGASSGSSPAKASGGSIHGPDVLNHWLEQERDSESDHTWEPDSEQGETDISITDDGAEGEVESDSSYEVLVPKSAASLLEEYASDETDESWSVHMK